MYVLDLFTGIGGFIEGGKRNGQMNTICCSEIDSYCCKFIDQNLALDNAGDIRNVAVPLAKHPHKSYADDDLVAVEETGFTTLCIEDFYEGVLPFPDVITGGFPCWETSPANLLNQSGIEGEHSGLVKEQLRIIESLEPQYCILENSERLLSRGLAEILAEFDRMGYSCQYEIVSCAHFGVPHYRHRLYLVAYLPTSKVAQNGVSIFDAVRFHANRAPNERFPFMNEADQSFVDFAVVKEPRSIKLRTKRINALGNAIFPEIAEHIFNAITDAESDIQSPLAAADPLKKSASLRNGQWFDGEPDLFGDLESGPIKLPTRGLMKNGQLWGGTPCRTLNPTKTQYKSMISTLTRKDGNNNCTSKSRTSRPGKLGGIVGELIRLGATEGGLSPVFCEQFMDFPPHYSELRQ